MDSELQVLGIDPTTYRFGSEQAAFEFTLQLLAQARRRIRLVGPTLDKNYYGRSPLPDLISRFARQNRQAEVQILIADAKSIVGVSHPLLDLSRRLPSRIKLRMLNPDYPNTTSTWLLCDGTGILYRKEPALFEGFANFSDAAVVKRFADEFEAMWQRASESPELRSLNL